uniref:Uncharacterized protein n=1 Tax=Moumouvirus sp. 'Monve' TaxID=1128131 RepID=H2EFW5_9VIRU|nr:hypothetical protein mv_R815 [Moumouvirus Monve]
MYFLLSQILKFLIWILNYVFDFDQINFRLGRPGLYKFDYSIIGYKKVDRCPNKYYKKGIYHRKYSDIILELEIPAGARIIRSNQSKDIDELRCDKAIIREVITTKPYKNFKKINIYIFHIMIIILFIELVKLLNHIYLMIILMKIMFLVYIFIKILGMQ